MIPVTSLLPDGHSISITGDGTVTSEISRSKGDYQTITEVTVKKSTALADRCFDGFIALLHISLPDTLKSIGSNCFYNCYCLLEIIIPEGVTMLNSGTFFRCNWLEYIKIPSSLNKISTAGLFYQTRNLKKFYIHEDNNFFSTDSQNCYLMNKNKTILYKGPGSSDVVVPDTVKIIERHFSYGCGITSISFKNSDLEEIISGAFIFENVETMILPNTTKRINANFYSGTIGTLYIPDSVEYFSDEALGSATIENVQVGKSPQVFYVDSEGIIFNRDQTTIMFVPSTAKMINMSSKVDFVPKNQILSHNILEVNVIGTPRNFSTVDGVVYVNGGETLYACPGGKVRVDVPDSCNRIDFQAFKNSLVEVVHLSDNVTRIDNQAFNDCKNLRSINIPRNLTHMGSWSFAGANSLNLSCKFPPSFYYCPTQCFFSSNVVDLDFSECASMRYIYTGVFTGSTLRSIVLPDCIKSISDEAFYDCKMLSSISLSRDLTYIGKESFKKCTSLQSVTFRGSSVASMAESCFQQSGILTIEIPPLVTELEPGIFKKCTSLESITFAGTPALREIKFGIISGCEKLASFEIPVSTLEIEPGAFSDAPAMMNFVTKDNANYTLRDGVLFYKAKPILFAFPGGRKSAKIESDVIGIESMAFKDCKSLISITFDSGSSIYSIGSFTFSGCSSLRSLELPGSISIIEKNAFDGCSELSSVVFGDGSKLKILSSSTFSGCSKLRSIYFRGESALERIGSSAMKDCKHLMTFGLPSSVKYIDDSAFEGCPELSGIVLLNVEEIGAKAFFGCEALKEITLPSTLTRLGDMAFAKCLGLKRILFCNPEEAKVGTACFDQCGAVGVHVPASYEEGKISGFVAIRSLDLECHIPTTMFTAGFLQGVTSIFPEIVLMVPYSDGEGGKLIF